MKPKREFVPVEFRQVAVSPGQELPLKTRQWAVLRIQSGAGQFKYAANSSGSVDEGDIIRLTPRADGSLGFTDSASLQLILWRPEALGGIFTLLESLSLEKWADDPSRALTVARSSPQISDGFKALENLGSDRNTIGSKVKILQVIAAVIAPELEAIPLSPAGIGAATRKFRSHALGMTEKELMRLSEPELRELCGCSSSHLGHMFQQHFGTTLMERQIHARIIEASLALLQSKATIGEIAKAAGFRSTELFSRKFREYLDMRPRRWKQKQLVSDDSLLECRL